MQKGDRILITGAGGMVGRALVQLLKNEGFDAPATALLTPNSRALDLRRQADVEAYFAAHRPQYVFHLAGRIGGIQANMRAPVEFLYENTLIALNVIHAAQAHATTKLLFAGSSCIYPRECPQPMHESHLLTGPLEPTNESYALAKIAGIKLVEALNKQQGAPHISLIPPNLYGPYDHFETENSHVISALIFKMHQAKQANQPTVEVWGSGNTRREFLYVEDFAQAMLHFIRHFTPLPHEGGTYVNTGCGSDQTIRELAQTIKDVVGYKGELVFNTSKPDGMPKKLIDTSRAHALGWTAKTGLVEGLKHTYEWYVKTL